MSGGAQYMLSPQQEMTRHKAEAKLSRVESKFGRGDNRWLNHRQEEGDLVEFSIRKN